MFPSLTPVNMYGPTEVTVTTVHYFFPRGFDNVVIGRPDPNTHAYILDSTMRPVPIGVPGELLLSGPRLAIGYAGRPDLTAAVFVPNPCLDLVAGRVDPALAPYYQLAYRTGDLVRWRNDGTIEFLGRIDRQVKITGVRIELGEVEAALEGAEGVSQAVATAVPDPSGQKRLVGYVTPGTADRASVIAHCRGLLVPAMVPSVVVTLDTFPLLPNGKVDVRSLPVPNWAAPAGLDAHDDDGVDVGDIRSLVSSELAVLDIIRDILGLEATARMPLKAELFDLGASSIQVAAIVSRVRKELGVQLDMRAVYQNPVLDTLLTLVKAQLPGAEG